MRTPRRLSAPRGWNRARAARSGLFPRKQKRPRSSIGPHWRASKYRGQTLAQLGGFRLLEDGELVARELETPAQLGELLGIEALAELPEHALLLRLDVTQDEVAHDIQPRVPFVRAGAAARELVEE